MKRKCWIAITISLAILLSSCSPKGVAVNKAKADEIWSAPSTVKILRDEDYKTNAIKGAAELELYAAKNEYESSQLIVTPEKAVSSYDLTPADLRSADGDILKKENIQVYTQKYIEVKQKMNEDPSFPVGFYPDAMVPVSNIREYGEDTIEAGKNQGFWITVYVPKEAKAGVYTAAFVLTLDGNTYEIPVKVTVWDFAVPDEVHTQSAFYTRREWLINGELDNSEEMYQTYYDYLLNYRLSSTNLPAFDIADVDAFVAVAKKYAADPRCSGYALPYKVTYSISEEKGGLIGDIDYTIAEEYLTRLAEESTKDLDLYEKLYCYFSSIMDEPNITGAVYEVRHVRRNLDALLAKIVKNLKAKDPDFFAKRKEGLEQRILSLQDLVTSHIMDSIDGYVTTYCPQVSYLNAEEERAKYADRLNQGSGTLWWYTCWQPKNPYPSYHTDDNLLSGRILSWMQKEYGIQGNLYWGTANYTIADNLMAKPADPYSVASRFIQGTANGDGYLLYPGVDYGVKGPLPSIRLESIRDGLEDYEYLWLLENSINELSSTYQQDFDFNRMVESLYRSLYTGTIPKIDPQVFFQARQELAKLVELAVSDTKAVLLIDGVDAISNSASISIYTADGCAVSVNNQALQGEKSGDGLRYTYTLQLDKPMNYIDAVFTKGDTEIEVHKFISNGSQKINLFDSEPDILRMDKSNADGKKEHITVSLNTDTAFSRNGNSAHVVIANGDLGNALENMAYMPSVSLTKEKNFQNISMDTVDSLNCEVFNRGDKDITVYVNFYAGSKERNIGKITLKAKAWTTVQIGQIYNMQWSELKNTDRIAFAFDNIADAAQQYDFYMDNLYCTLKA